MLLNPERCFRYSVHPIYIDESRLNVRNASCYNATRHNSTSLRNESEVESSRIHTDNIKLHNDDLGYFIFFVYVRASVFLFCLCMVSCNLTVYVSHWKTVPCIYCMQVVYNSRHA